MSNNATGAQPGLSPAALVGSPAHHHHHQPKQNGSGNSSKGVSPSSVVAVTVALEGEGSIETDAERLRRAQRQNRLLRRQVLLMQQERRELRLRLASNGGASAGVSAMRPHTEDDCNDGGGGGGGPGHRSSALTTTPTTAAAAAAGEEEEEAALRVRLATLQRKSERERQRRAQVERELRGQIESLQQAINNSSDSSPASASVSPPRRNGTPQQHFERQQQQRAVGDGGPLSYNDGDTSVGRNRNNVGNIGNFNKSNANGSSTDTCSTLADQQQQKPRVMAAAGGLLVAAAIDHSGRTDNGDGNNGGDADADLQRRYQETIDRYAAVAAPPGASTEADDAVRRVADRRAQRRQRLERFTNSSVTAVAVAGMEEANATSMGSGEASPIRTQSATITKATEAEVADEYNTFNPNQIGTEISERERDHGWYLKQVIAKALLFAIHPAHKRHAHAAGDDDDGIGYGGGGGGGGAASSTTTASAAAAAPDDNNSVFSATPASRGPSGLPSHHRNNSDQQHQPMATDAAAASYIYRDINMPAMQHAIAETMTMHFHCRRNEAQLTPEYREGGPVIVGVAPALGTATLTAPVLATRLGPFADENTDPGLLTAFAPLHTGSGKRGGGGATGSGSGAADVAATLEARGWDPSTKQPRSRSKGGAATNANNTHSSHPHNTSNYSNDDEDDVYAKLSEAVYYNMLPDELKPESARNAAAGGVAAVPGGDRRKQHNTRAGDVDDDGDRYRDDEVTVQFHSPVIFSQIRSFLRLDEDYLRAGVADSTWRESASLGKSKTSLYYFSDFVIKSMKAGEVAYFNRCFLPYYVQYCERNPHTLLPRFYAVVTVKWLKLDVIKTFVLMQNVFTTRYYIHRIYDVKGSTVGRSGYTTDPNNKRNADGTPAVATAPRTAFGALLLKDNDLPRQLIICGPYQRAIMLAQLRSDVQFLASLNIVDYSCMVGVRSRVFTSDQGPSKTTLLRRRRTTAPAAQTAEHASTASATAASPVASGSGPVAFIYSGSSSKIKSRPVGARPHLHHHHNRSSAECPGSGVRQRSHRYGSSTTAGGEELTERQELAMTSGGDTDSIDDVYVTRTVADIARGDGLGDGGAAAATAAGLSGVASILAELPSYSGGGVATLAAPLVIHQRPPSRQPSPLPSAGGGGPRNTYGYDFGPASAFTPVASPVTSREMPLPVAVAAAAATAAASSASRHIDEDDLFICLHGCDGGLLSLPIYAPGDDTTAREDVYYLGIIDVLQEYNSAKKLESFAKGLVNDRTQISVIPPRDYAQRLYKVIERIAD